MPRAEIKENLDRDEGSEGNRAESNTPQVAPISVWSPSSRIT
jgi:hypothetical protein